LKFEVRSLKRGVSLNSQLSTLNSQLPHGTVFTAGSLHGPTPAAPTARTRTHAREPIVSDGSVALDLGDVILNAQLVAVIGSGLV
jgi:hypothetical protein